MSDQAELRTFMRREFQRMALAQKTEEVFAIEEAMTNYICQQLEAAKAREEALTPLPSGDRRSFAIFITPNGIFLHAFIDDEETIDAEKFESPADLLERLVEYLAAGNASEPPGTAEGEEGTP